MSTQEKSSNGTATQKPENNGKPAASTTTMLTVVKDEKPKDEKLPAKLPPLDERLHRLNQLFELQGKYNRLQTSLTRLKSFELGKDDETCKITFADKNRNEFSTSNQFLMPKFLAFVKTEIQAKIKEIEPLLIW